MARDHHGTIKLELLKCDISTTQSPLKYSVALNIVQSSPSEFHIVLLRDEQSG